MTDAIPLRTALTSSLAEARALKALEALAAKGREMEFACGLAQQAIADLIEECRRYQRAAEDNDSPTGAIIR